MCVAVCADRESLSKRQENKHKKRHCTVKWSTFKIVIHHPAGCWGEHIYVNTTPRKRVRDREHMLWLTQNIARLLVKYTSTRNAALSS